MIKDVDTVLLSLGLGTTMQFAESILYNYKETPPELILYRTWHKVGGKKRKRNQVVLRQSRKYL